MRSKLVLTLAALMAAGAIAKTQTQGRPPTLDTAHAAHPPNAACPPGKSAKKGRAAMHGYRLKAKAGNHAALPVAEGSVGGRGASMHDGMPGGMRSQMHVQMHEPMRTPGAMHE